VDADQDRAQKGRKVRQIRFVAVSLAIFTLVLASPASASSSVVADATGDATAGSPAYLDIVQVKVTDQVGRNTLYFSAELAAAIPATPPDDFLAYNWFVDVNFDNTPDYVVVVRRCTAGSTPRCAAPGPLPRWEAFVNDFVHPVIYFSSFSVNGATVQAFVDPDLLGGASAFQWFALTRSRPAASGTAPVDFAPDEVFATFGR
jgi:hypothetical protein